MRIPFICTSRPRRSSTYIELWIGLASLYLHTGNLENAIHCCNIASILNPNHFTVWHIRGIILRKKGDFHRAKFCYAKCLELKQRNIAALHDKASIHLYLEEYQQADICFDKILELDPLNVEAMINKGLLALSVENYHIATELFNRAIKIEKDSPKVVASKELLSKIGFLFEK